MVVIVSNKEINGNSAPLALIITADVQVYNSVQQKPLELYKKFRLIFTY